jgi:hypothetical protein
VPTNFLAGGNISPRRFVVQNTDDFTVVQSDATPGKPPAGVSQPGVQGAPGTPFDDGYAANDGDHVLVWGLGEQCDLDVGDNSGNPGTFLKPDANGRGVAFEWDSSGEQHYGARAEEGWTSSGTAVRVTIVYGGNPSA